MSLSGHALRSSRYRVLANGAVCVGVTEVCPRDPDPCGGVLGALHSTHGLPADFAVVAEITPEANASLIDANGPAMTRFSCSPE